MSTVTRGTTTGTTTTGRRMGTMHVARSRGALSGFLLVLLGIWGAVIPFVGPYFTYAYTPDSAWTWTWGRLWLEVLPGIAAIIGGLILATTINRAFGIFAGWLASAAGAWFVVGPILGRLWGGAGGAAGTPVGGTTRQVVEEIGFFAGLGVVILFLAAYALGRYTVWAVRDVRAAERRAVLERDRLAADTAVAGPVVEERPAHFHDNRVDNRVDDRVDETTVTRTMPAAGTVPPDTMAPAEGTARPEGPRIDPAHQP